MRQRLLLSTLALLLAFSTLPAADAQAYDVKDTVQLSLGAGTGLLTGSLDSDTAALSKLNSRWPAFLDLSVAWGLTNDVMLGLHVAGTVEDSLAVSYTPRVSWHIISTPVFLALAGGPVFYGDPFLFGVELGFSVGYMFNRHIGIEADLTPQLLFVGDSLTGSGVVIPLLFSIGVRGSL